MPADHKALIVGAGSIGRRHIRNLRACGVSAIAACDPVPDRLEPAVQESSITPFSDYAQALRAFRPSIVFVCTPPVFHIEQALAALRAGADLFIEKPLSHAMPGIRQLESEARAHGAIVQVGYNMRYHPGVRRLKELAASGALGRILWARAEVAQYLPDWRPWQDYRQSYTARRELGGGMILDGSHEIDYVLWMLGEPVEVLCMAGRTSNLEVDVEDCATILLRFARGAQADIHLDFIQRSPARSCKLAGELGTATWDSVAETVTVQWPGDRPADAVRVPEVDNETYEAELQEFLACVAERKTPLVDLTQAARVVDVCVRAKDMACGAQATS